jgi:acyl carrier protein
MTKEDFLKEFSDILQLEDPITLETELDGLEDWDSLNKMSTVSWFLENNIQITVNEISSFKTVGEIAERMNVK